MKSGERVDEMQGRLGKARGEAREAQEAAGALRRAPKPTEGKGALPRQNRAPFS